MLNSALRRAVAWRILQRNPTEGVTVPARRRKRRGLACRGRRDVPGEDRRRPACSNVAPRLRQRNAIGRAACARVGRRRPESRRSFGASDPDAPRDKGWKLGEVPKTSSSRRSISSGQPTAAALRSLRPKQAERRLRCGRAWVNHGLVFDRGNGDWLAPTTVRGFCPRRPPRPSYRR